MPNADSLGKHTRLIQTGQAQRRLSASFSPLLKPHFVPAANAPCVRTAFAWGTANGHAVLGSTLWKHCQEGERSMRTGLNWISAAVGLT